MTMEDINFLKVNDPDRYLLLLFISDRSARNSCAALDMLNVEIARLRDTIETPHMGFIRLQWWRDEIKKIYAGEKYAPHPIVETLANILPNLPVTFEDMDALISGRDADFEEYDDFDMFGYARGIHLPLLNMKRKILGEGSNTDALAEGFAVIGLLRAIPFYRARSQVLMPSIQPDAVKQICERAEALLNANTATHRYFKAHDVLARLYLKQIKNVGHQPEKLMPLPFKELRVWWNT